MWKLRYVALAVILFAMAGVSCASPAPSTYNTATFKYSGASADGFMWYCDKVKGIFNDLTKFTVASPLARSVSLSSLPCMKKDGNYFLSVTAFNIYGESGGSNWVPFTVTGGKVVNTNLPNKATGVQLK